MSNGRIQMTKRRFAVVFAFVALASIFIVPAQKINAASGKIKQVEVSNLPADQLTIKRGKKFTLKTKVTVTGKISKKVAYKSNNRKVAMVNAKGKITAKKKGTATITVYAKNDKKKKCKIKVTVGTPVANITLNQTEAGLNIGESMALKTILFPKKPSNTGIIWKSSDTGIATVADNGVVQAIKEGTAMITATAKDGSGKEAVCKVTVKKADAPVPTQEPKPEPKPEPEPTPEPVSVKSMNVSQQNLLEVTFTKPIELKAADFQVWTKKYENADYLKQYTIAQVTTTDSITYKIEIKGTMLFQKGSYIKAVVPKWNLSGECVYLGDTYTIERSKTLMYEVGSSVDYSISQVLGNGYSDCSVSGLPAGIQYEIITDASKRTLTFKGAATKTGRYTSKVIYEDELGNKFNLTVSWIIYGEGKLGVQDSVKVLLNTSGVLTSQLRVYGGNGSDSTDYIYEIVPEESDSEAVAVCKLTNDGRTIDVGSKRLAPGTYKLCIRATDKKDASLTSKGILTLRILEGGYLQGTIRDANGDPMDTFSFIIRNHNEYAEYSDVIKSLWSGKQNGRLLCSDLEVGTYDVTVSNESKTVSTTVYSLQTQKAVNGEYPVKSFDITLPVYKVNVRMAKDVPEAFKDYYSFDEWRDVSSGQYYGTGQTLYLEIGTYHLTFDKEVEGVNYHFFMDVTVNGGNTTGYVSVKE